MPLGYLLLELSKLFVPQLDLSLSKERSAFDGLKPLLVFRNLCLSKSTPACGAALEPFPALSFLDLLAGSFLRAISCEDTICKVSLQEITTYHNKKPKSNKNGVHFFPTKRKCQGEFREKLTHRCVGFSRTYIYLCTHIFPW